jgi:putative tricarboxylic transport membrane protein
LLLGLVLGALLENNLRRGLVLSRGDVILFLSDPLTLALLASALVVLLTTIVPSVARRREKIAAADD